MNAMNPSDSILSAQEAEKVIAFAKEQAGKMFHKLPLLGPVTWLMLQQPHTRHTLLSELEWRVIPALMRDQAKLYMRDGLPIAYVSWANFSNQVAQRYRTPPHQLSYTDWDCGDEVWLVDIVTPFGGLQQVMEDVRRNVHPGKAVHQLAPVPSDLSKVLTWPAV